MLPSYIPVSGMSGTDRIRSPFRRSSCSSSESRRYRCFRRCFSAPESICADFLVPVLNKNRSVLLLLPLKRTVPHHKSIGHLLYKLGFVMLNIFIKKLVYGIIYRFIISNFFKSIFFIQTNFSTHNIYL